MTLTKQASPIFGEKFPYPLDGKQVLYEIASQFAAEFNQLAKAKRLELYPDQRLEWTDLVVTSAYPTVRQQCPRIAIQRMGSSPRLSGLGGEIETREVTLDDSSIKFRIYKGQIITDTIEIGICTLNEKLRDDMYTWFQQYMLDAIWWVLPQLAGLSDLRLVNAIDDLVEYQGSNTQPGFEFYIARLTYQVQYEMVVLEDVNRLESIINWQQVVYANEDARTST